MRELWRTVVTTSRNVMDVLRPVLKTSQGKQTRGFQMTAPKPPRTSPELDKALDFLLKYPAQPLSGADVSHCANCWKLHQPAFCPDHPAAPVAVPAEPRQKVRMTVDEDCGAIYVYVRGEIAPKGVKRTETVRDEDPVVNFDYDEHGQLLGIEVLP